MALLENLPSFRSAFPGYFVQSMPGINFIPTANPYVMPFLPALQISKDNSSPKCNSHSMELAESESRVSSPKRERFAEEEGKNACLTKIVE